MKRPTNYTAIVAAGGWGLSHEFLSAKAKAQARDQHGRFIKMNSLVRWLDAGKKYHWGHVAGISVDGSEISVHENGLNTPSILKPKDLEVVKAIIPDSPSVAPPSKKLDHAKAKAASTGSDLASGLKKGDLFSPSKGPNYSKVYRAAEDYNKDFKTVSVQEIKPDNSLGEPEVYTPSAFDAKQPSAINKVLWPETAHAHDLAEPVGAAKASTHSVNSSTLNPGDLIKRPDGSVWRVTSKFVGKGSPAAGKKYGWGSKTGNVEIENVATGVKAKLQGNDHDSNFISDKIKNPDDVWKGGSSTPSADNLTPDDSPIEEPLYVNTSGFKKVGSQGGSNPGGTYEDPKTGEQFYVKLAQSEQHAANEVLAARLYEAAGVGAPQVYLTEVNGEPGVASRIVPDLKPLYPGGHTTPASLKEGRHGFAMDAWLANWDSVGLVYDNLMATPDGKAVRVDTGGAMLYRAQGEPKGSMFTDTVGETETLRSTKNAQAHKIFGGMTNAQVAQDIADTVNKVSDAEVAKLIDELPFDNQDTKNSLKAKLKARKEDLNKKFDIPSEADSQAVVDKHAPKAVIPATPAEVAPTAADNFDQGGPHLVPEVTQSAPSESEAQAFKSYVGSNYHSINQYLRTGTYDSGQWTGQQDVPTTVAELDKLVNSGKSKNDSVLYRGASHTYLSEDAQVGSVFSDKGFLSATSDYSTAKNKFTDPKGKTNTILEIHAPAGSTMLDAQEAGSKHFEGEFVLPKDSSFKIVEMGKQSDGTHYAVVELLPHSPASPQKIGQKADVNPVTEADKKSISDSVDNFLVNGPSTPAVGQTDNPADLTYEQVPANQLQIGDVVSQSDGHWKVTGPAVKQYKGGFAYTATKIKDDNSSSGMPKTFPLGSPGEMKSVAKGGAEKLTIKAPKEAPTPPTPTAGQSGFVNPDGTTVTLAINLNKGDLIKTSTGDIVELDGKFQTNNGVTGKFLTGPQKGQPFQNKAHKSTHFNLVDPNSDEAKAAKAASEVPESVPNTPAVSPVPGPADFTITSVADLKPGDWVQYDKDGWGFQAYKVTEPWKPGDATLVTTDQAGHPYEIDMYGNDPQIHAVQVPTKAADNNFAGLTYESVGAGDLQPGDVIKAGSANKPYYLKVKVSDGNGNIKGDLFVGDEPSVEIHKKYEGMLPVAKAGTNAPVAPEGVKPTVFGQPEEDHPKSKLNSPLSFNEKDQLDTYQGQGADHVNGYLRKGTHPSHVNPEDLDEMAAVLDTAIAKATLTKSGIVFRGFKGKHLPTETMAPGTMIDDKGFVSTSTSFDTGLEFAQMSGPNGAVFEIQLSEGQHALDVTHAELSGYEQELILPRNGKFEVVEDGKLASHSLGGGTRYVRVKFIEGASSDGKPAASEAVPSQEGKPDVPGGAQEGVPGPDGVGGGPGNDHASGSEGVTPPHAPAAEGEGTNAVDLKVGDVVEINGKQWKVTAPWDSFGKDFGAEPLDGFGNEQTVPAKGSDKFKKVDAPEAPSTSGNTFAPGDHIYEPDGTYVGVAKTVDQESNGQTLSITKPNGELGWYHVSHDYSGDLVKGDPPTKAEPGPYSNPVGQIGTTVKSTKDGFTGKVVNVNWTTGYSLVQSADGSKKLWRSHKTLQTADESLAPETPAESDAPADPIDSLIEVGNHFGIFSNDDLALLDDAKIGAIDQHDVNELENGIKQYEQAHEENIPDVWDAFAKFKSHVLPSADDTPDSDPYSNLPSVGPHQISVGDKVVYQGKTQTVTEKGFPYSAGQNIYFEDDEGHTSWTTLTSYDTLKGVQIDSLDESSAPDAAPETPAEALAPSAPTGTLVPGSAHVYQDAQGKYTVNKAGHVLREGMEVKSTKDGFTGTITQLEKGPKYAKVKGPDGKVKGRQIDSLEPASKPSEPSAGAPETNATTPSTPDVEKAPGAVAPVKNLKPGDKVTGNGGTDHYIINSVAPGPMAGYYTVNYTDQNGEIYNDPFSEHSQSFKWPDTPVEDVSAGPKIGETVTAENLKPGMVFSVKNSSSVYTVTAVKTLPNGKISLDLTGVDGEVANGHTVPKDTGSNGGWILQSLPGEPSAPKIGEPIAAKDLKPGMVFGTYTGSNYTVNSVGTSSDGKHTILDLTGPSGTELKGHKVSPDFGSGDTPWTLKSLPSEAVDPKTLKPGDKILYNGKPATVLESEKSAFPEDGEWYLGVKLDDGSGLTKYHWLPKPDVKLELPPNDTNEGSGFTPPADLHVGDDVTVNGSNLSEPMKGKVWNVTPSTQIDGAQYVQITNSDGLDYSFHVMNDGTKPEDSPSWVNTGTVSKGDAPAQSTVKVGDKIPAGEFKPGMVLKTFPTSSHSYKVNSVKTSPGNVNKVELNLTDVNSGEVYPDHTLFKTFSDWIVTELPGDAPSPSATPATPAAPEVPNGTLVPGSSHVYQDSTGRYTINKHGHVLREGMSVTSTKDGSTGTISYLELGPKYAKVLMPDGTKKGRQIDTLKPTDGAAPVTAASVKKAQDYKSGDGVLVNGSPGKVYMSTASNYQEQGEWYVAVHMPNGTNKNMFVSNGPKGVTGVLAHTSIPVTLSSPGEPAPAAVDIYNGLEPGTPVPPADMKPGMILKGKTSGSLYKVNSVSKSPSGSHSVNMTKLATNQEVHKNLLYSAGYLVPDKKDQPASTPAAPVESFTGEAPKLAPGKIWKQVGNKKPPELKPGDVVGNDKKTLEYQKPSTKVPGKHEIKFVGDSEPITVSKNNDHWQIWEQVEPGVAGKKKPENFNAGDIIELPDGTKHVFEDLSEWSDEDNHVDVKFKGEDGFVSIPESHSYTIWDPGTPLTKAAPAPAAPEPEAEPAGPVQLTHDPIDFSFPEGGQVSVPPGGKIYKGKYFSGSKPFMVDAFNQAWSLDPATGEKTSFALAHYYKPQLTDESTLFANPNQPDALPHFDTAIPPDHLAELKTALDGYSGTDTSWNYTATYLNALKKVLDDPSGASLDAADYNNAKGGIDYAPGSLPLDDPKYDFTPLKLEITKLQKQQTGTYQYEWSSAYSNGQYFYDANERKALGALGLSPDAQNWVTTKGVIPAQNTDAAAEIYATVSDPSRAAVIDDLFGLGTSAKIANKTKGSGFIPGLSDNNSPYSPAVPDLPKTDGKNGMVIYLGDTVIASDGQGGQVVLVTGDGKVRVKRSDGTSFTRKGTQFVVTSGTVNATKPHSAQTGEAKTYTAKPRPEFAIPDWSKGNIGGTATPQQALETIKASTVAGHVGTSFAAGGSQVEDMDVHMSRVLSASGQEMIELKFKLTPKQGYAMFKRHSADPEWTESYMKVDGRQVTDTGKLAQLTGQPTYTGHGGWTLSRSKADGTEFRHHFAKGKSMSQSGSNPAAFHNLVQIRLPASATHSDIAKALYDAGVDVPGPPTKEHLKRLGENRLLSLFGRKTNAWTGNDAVKEPERSNLLSDIKSKWGVTADDLEIANGTNGRFELRLPQAVADKIADKIGVNYFVHNLYHGASTDLPKIGSNHFNALLSTTIRRTEGVKGDGMSSSSDIGTGGADYVFTRAKKTLAPLAGQLVFDARRLFRRMDWFSRSSDEFGARTPNMDILGNTTVGGSQETMFKHRLDLDDAIGYLVNSSSERQQLIDLLKSQGITMMGSRTVEDFIILAPSTNIQAPTPPVPTVPVATLGGAPA